MNDPPPHVGRPTDQEVGYALVCTYEGDGPLCRAPATWHIMWTEDAENGLSCDQHKRVGYAFDAIEIHSVADSACGIPGAIWLKDEHRCVMDLLEDEPAQAARAEVGA